VVERFGRTRDIRAGTFGTLGQIGITERFDLIVCCDVLQYVRTEEMGPGLSAVAGMLDGVAYLEAFTDADELVGDKRHWHQRTPTWYRQVLRGAGLTAVGMHCYVGERLRDSTLALERAE
jgi:hypothetical protein